MVDYDDSERASGIGAPHFFRGSRMARAILLLAMMLGLVSGAAAQSGPAEDSPYGTPAEARHAPFFAVMPACDDPGVLGQISDRFSQAETIFWDGQHAIAGYTRVRELGFRSNGVAFIPRRYCIARAVMAEPPQVPAVDRPQRTIIYSIASDAGMFGQSLNVAWCVVGLDREHAYAPDCEVLKPVLLRSIGQYQWLATYGLKALY